MAKLRYVLMISLATLAAGPAFAQATAPAAGTAPAKFVTQSDRGQYRASKFVGVEIYNSDNQDIGEVSDLVVDKNGSIQAVVVGVGGFLGIGEKSVALPFTAIKWDDKPLPSASVGMNNAPATTPAAPATPGMTPVAPAPMPVAPETVKDYPDHDLLNMTKDELKAAPDFKFASEK